MALIQPKPCPYCGGKKVQVNEYGIGAFVECERSACNAMGPNRGTRLGAVKAWNRILRPDEVKALRAAARVVTPEDFR